MLTPEQRKGSHSTIPVVRVKATNEDGFTEINEHDFNPSVHEKFEGEVPVRAAPAPTPVVVPVADFDSMNKSELKDWLDAKGVQYGADATKADLIELCKAKPA